MRSFPWRATAAAAAIVLTSCRSAPLMSPQQIDRMSAQCRKRLAPGSVDVREIRSANIGHRASNEPAGTPVVLYGAAWCPACGIAASYMARRGIPFVERDVEEDPGAEAAATSTLRLAGLDADVLALPVIDVRGTVMRGFYPCVVEVAWTD